MIIGVSKIGWGANAENFCLLFVDSFEDAGVQDWSFSSGVNSDQKDEVGVFDAFYLGVEEEIGPKVVGESKILSLSKLIIETVKSIYEVLQSLNVFYALKFADSAGNFIAIDFIDARCHHG